MIGRRRVNLRICFKLARYVGNAGSSVLAVDHHRICNPLVSTVTIPTIRHPDDPPALCVVARPDFIRHGPRRNDRMLAQ